MSSKPCGFNRNKGITLVELLIVIIVIGIIAAILLPALGGSRDGRSRRTTCANKIRNIALACINYESSNEQFPAAVSYRGESFLVRILPMLDIAPLYDDFRANPDDNSAKNDLATVELDYLRCDSTPANDNESDHFAGFTSHYTGSAGPASSNLEDKYGSAEFSYQTDGFGPVGLRGLFSPTVAENADANDPFARATKNGVSAIKVSDGLSNTLAIVETSRSDFDNGKRTFTNNRPRWPWGVMEGNPTKVNWSRSIARTVNSYDDVPHQEIPFHELPISSNHPGGAHVVNGDGSTRFVSDDIDLIVLQAVGGIDEGDEENQDLDR